VIGYVTPDYELVHAFRAHRWCRTPSRVAPRPASRIFQTAVKLSELFREGETVAVRGPLDRPISGIVMDSRRVAPGNLFFALPGLRSDGARYIDEAIQRGAVAVATVALPAIPHAKVTFVQVADARAALACVARRYHRAPDADLKVIGITGTNGKTTIAHLLRHFLSAGGTRRVGMLGTINFDLGQRTVPSYKTTPESLDVFGMLAQMRSAGCAEAVMEVSSHGLDQKRVLGLAFAVAVFTNLTRDHLDYHRSFERYFAAKTALFTGGVGAVPPVAVINVDDPHGRQLVALVPAGVRIVTFGESADAEVRAEAIALGFKGTAFQLVFPGGALPITTALIGRYNVSNLLAAFATLHGLGRDLAAAAASLAVFRAPAGRMERIEEGQPFNVLVDYAHTDDALRNALGMLRAITPGRLLVVFGCGGSRDRTKRPLMTAAVQEVADFAWATADNPRAETISAIFADMRPGVSAPARIVFVEDRRRAISLALDAARAGDSLLIAGKGHETFQEFADTVIPFDDRQVVRELIAVKQLKA
jgi:UDP-N-acetylmuramoyl-L-alanyl-D-glutamate--2,6-diaminopimelate ligase